MIEGSVLISSLTNEWIFFFIHLYLIVNTGATMDTFIYIIQLYYHRRIFEFL